VINGGDARRRVEHPHRKTAGLVPHDQRQGGPPATRPGRFGGLRLGGRAVSGRAVETRRGGGDQSPRAAAGPPPWPGRRALGWPRLLGAIHAASARISNYGDGGQD
jgi:hypothetical protein